MGALLLAGLAAAPVEAVPPGGSEAAPPASPSSPLSPAKLRDQFERADKLLRRAADAAEGSDPGRVSLLLQRADEEIVRFEASSGLAPLIEAVAASREAAGRQDLTAAEASLRRARPWIASLSDYAVPRSAEIAFRAAQAAATEGDAPGFLAALDQFEAATLAPALLARLRETRQAVARARTVLVRGDLKGGRREVASARASFDGLTYAGALSRSHYGLLVASELLRDRALLAARDQAQKGLRDLRLAIPLAPEAARDSLLRAQEEATTVWRRINRPAEGDADLLAGASGVIEGARQQWRAFRPPDVVAE